MPFLTIDLHSHLLEKGVNPRNYWRAAKAKRLDAVAITEHVTEKPESAYSMLLENKPRSIALLPGAELDTDIGHVIALAKNSEIYSIEGLFRKKIPIKKALRIAEQEGILLSIVHPWGFSNDSAAYILGEKKLRALVERERIGVEAFNGMFANVSGFFYATSWVKKPMNFFDFLEKSRLGKKTRLSRLGRKGKEKIDKKGREIVERCTKPFELAELACFATAGSDAHKPNRLGTGIMKLEAERKSPERILEAVQDKGNVKWIGPYARETGSGYSIDRVSIQKAEVLSGLKYAAKSTLIKKVKGRKESA